MADSSPEQRRKSPGRPFQKGQSGNPGGRVGVPKEVREAARELSDRAIARLEYWMDSDNPKASVTATLAIIERAWGKTVQSVELSGKNGGPVQVVTYDIPNNSRSDAGH